MAVNLTQNQERSKSMKGCNGEIIFACGNRYTEVPQKAISQLFVGEKMLVYKNEDFSNYPKAKGPRQHTCFSCPCKRKAKRKEDMFFHRDDIDPKTDQPHRSPTGVAIVCAVAELTPDTSGKEKVTNPPKQT